MATQTARAQYDFAGLEGVWDAAGGNQQAAPWAAAVAMAESGGNVFAHSASNDVGLWQINATYHPPSQATYDVMGNARAAIAISGNGANWAAWCTAWANPSQDCGHGLLPVPQRGSKAYAMYLQYQGTPPDTSVALNGTNAAANDALTAEQASFPCPCLPGFLNICCIPGLSGIGGAILKGIIDGILSPLIAPIVAAMGMAAGGVMMLFGIFLMVRQTDTYQSAKQAGSQVVGTGLTAAGMATGQPELIAAGGATGGIAGRAGAAGRQRITTIRGQEVQQRFQQRSDIVAARASGQRAEETAAQQQRLQQSTQEQLRRQAAMYQQRQAQRVGQPFIPGGQRTGNGSRNGR